jgi:hypothetical protein
MSDDDRGYWSFILCAAAFSLCRWLGLPILQSLIIGAVFQECVIRVVKPYIDGVVVRPRYWFMDAECDRNRRAKDGD